MVNHKSKKRRGDDPNDSSMELKLQLEGLESELFDIKNSLEKTVLEVKRLAAENLELKQEIKSKDNTISNLVNKSNEAEQYSRRNNIRIFGLKDGGRQETIFDTEKLVLRLFNHKLGVKLSASDVDITHRLGKLTRDSDRPVIVKFSNRKAKISVITQRKNLKGSRVVITEDLTSANYRLLQQTRDLTCVTQTWTREGRIYAKNDSGQVVEVKAATCLDERLFQRQQQNADRPGSSPAGASPSSGGTEPTKKPATTPPVLSDQRRPSSDQPKSRSHSSTTPSSDSLPSSLSPHTADQREKNPSRDTTITISDSDTMPSGIPDSGGSPTSSSTPNAKGMKGAIVKHTSK